MFTKDKAITKGGNLKKVDLQTIIQRVKEAWAEISSETVVRLFKKCCINSAMDGSEDNLIYNNTMDCSSDTDNDENDMHPGIPTTQNGFEELFGKSDAESDFEGFE